MIAQELAIRHPERVRRLVLVGTTPGWSLGYPPPRTTAKLLLQQRSLPPDVLLRRSVENALSAATIARHPELVDRLIRHQRAHRPDPAGWRAQAAAGAAWPGRGRQSAIRAETLVLQGTDDAVVDPRNAHVLVDLIAGARLQLLPGIGHLPFWEQPGPFVDTVTEFLKRPATTRG